MLVISSREFRANTGHYLDLVAKGMDVILKSRALGSFRLTALLCRQKKVRSFVRTMVKVQTIL